nr:hypothetical protein [Tanacetum cinerariifolium]
MSSDSHATITYTSMSSYEVIVIGGENDANDDGDDFSEDDVDDEDREESLDSEEEEEEHLASTVPAPALYSFVSASEETEPFEEGEMLGIKCTRHSHCQERVPTGSISSHYQ